MAKLISENLSLEIKYMEYDEYGWIQYELTFLYKNRPMILDRLLKRATDYYRQRHVGAFKAEEYKQDRLIERLQTALDTDQPQYYEPVDPDFLFAVYPNTVFPFIPSGGTVIYASDAYIQHAQDEDLIREIAGGRLPGDIFSIIVFVDIYGFGNEDVYMGEGPALIMHPTREKFRQFIEELRSEYQIFCKQWNIDDQSSDSG